VFVWGRGVVVVGLMLRHRFWLIVLEFEDGHRCFVEKGFNCAFGFCSNCVRAAGGGGGESRVSSEVVCTGNCSRGDGHDFRPACVADKQTPCLRHVRQY